MASAPSVATSSRPASFAEVRRQAARYNVIPLTRTLLADLETPVAAYLQLASGDQGRYSYLLESVTGGEIVGRYSYIGWAPYRLLRQRQGRVEELRPPERRWKPLAEDLITAARAEVARRRLAPVEGHRFLAGAVGYLGYDWVRSFEKLPARAQDDLGVDEALLMFFSRQVIFDHVRRQMTLVACVMAEPGRSLAAEYARARRDLEAMERRLRRPPRLPRPARPPRRPPPRHADAGPVPGGGAPRPRIHPRRRRLPDRALAALGPAHRGASVSGLSRAAHDQSLALHVLSPAGRPAPGGRLAGAVGRHRRPRDSLPAHRRHAPAGRDAGARRGPGSRAAHRRQGARRARHAGGPGPQRRGPGGGDRLGARAAAHVRGEILARAALGQRRARAAGARARSLRRPARLLSRGYADGRAQGAGHGNHRGARAHPPRRLWRRGALPGLFRRPQRLHCHPHHPHARRRRARPGGSGHRRRLAARARARGVPQQSRGAAARHRHGGRRAALG